MERRFMIGNIVRTEKDFAIARESDGTRTYYLLQPSSGRSFALGEAVEWIVDPLSKKQLGFRARRIKATPIQDVAISKQTCEEEGVGK
jgi:hypothetical protein